MKVNFLETAEQDLIDVYRYIAVENHAPESAERLIQELEQKTVKMLSDFPQIGKRIDSSENIRFIVVRNYSVIYKIVENQIFIMNFYGAGRDWR